MSPLVCNEVRSMSEGPPVFITDRVFTPQLFLFCSPGHMPRSNSIPYPSPLCGCLSLTIHPVHQGVQNGWRRYHFPYTLKVHLLLDLTKKAKGISCWQCSTHLSSKLSPELCWQLHTKLRHLTSEPHAQKPFKATLMLSTDSPSPLVTHSWGF